MSIPTLARRPRSPSAPTLRAAGLASLVAALLSSCGPGGASEGGSLEGPGLVGILADASAEPLPHAEVLACMASTCLYGRTDDAGRFAFRIEPPADIAVKTESRPWSTPRRGAALCPVRLEGDQPLDVGTVYVPTLGPGTPVPRDSGPAPLPLGDGLQLTVDRADLQPLPGQTLTEISARQVDPNRVCDLLEVEGEEIVAVYALDPFGATSASPMGVRLESALPAGTSVRLRTISEIDGLLSEAVPAVADGIAITTAPDQGIHELTWLVVSR